MMPTKERLDKERLRKQEIEAFGTIPEHMANADMSLNEIVLQELGFYRTNLCKYDKNGEPYKVALHPEKPSNDKRAAEKFAEALRLKDKYPCHWGKRGGPKCIAIAEGMNMDNDNAIRKIQKYFIDFP